MIATISMPIKISAKEITCENTPKEIQEFIMDLDLAVADASFTESIILQLAKDLAGDSRTRDIQRIGRTIMEMEGYAP